MKLPLGRVAQSIGAEGDFPGDVMALGYSIDSRTIKPGELFFAVKGERLDGHDYVTTAMERGAVGAVIGRKHLGRYVDNRQLRHLRNAVQLQIICKRRVSTHIGQHGKGACCDDRATDSQPIESIRKVHRIR